MHWKTTRSTGIAFSGRNPWRKCFRGGATSRPALTLRKRTRAPGEFGGSAGGYMIKGDPIYSLTANKHGLHVRFSNLESIEDYHDGLDMPLDWDAATGEWVHVEIITTFGKSMVVRRNDFVKRWFL
ncbi:unnamed protein product [Ectocarpus fasciculatus]